MHWHWRRNHRFTEQLSTGAYYPPVVTAGRFLLPEHPTWQRGHCAMECLTWIFLSSEFACFVAGEIIQVIEAMPGSVVPLAMFFCNLRVLFLYRPKYYIILYPFNFQACHKSQYWPGPSVTGPRRKRSQYWPWICALCNTGMASHLGRRPRAILQYWPRAIM